MLPARILVMRHAEKVDDPEVPDLSRAGRERAASLSSWLPGAIGRPDFIFAASASRHSKRPIETVQPLAEALGMVIDASFADQDYGALARHLLTNRNFSGALILVCWHHGNIPNMLNSLGVPAGSYPDPWSRDVFNTVLAITAPDGSIAVERIVEPF